MKWFGFEKIAPINGVSINILCFEIENEWKNGWSGHRSATQYLFGTRLSLVKEDITCKSKNSWKYLLKTVTELVVFRTDKIAAQKSFETLYRNCDFFPQRYVGWSYIFLMPVHGLLSYFKANMCLNILLHT